MMRINQPRRQTRYQHQAERPELMRLRRVLAGSDRRQELLQRLPDQEQQDRCRPQEPPAVEIDPERKEQGQIPIDRQRRPAHPFQVA